MKRKRKIDHRDSATNNKRTCVEGSNLPKPPLALLRQYYPIVSTLRQYLIAKLPSNARKHRRKLSRYGHNELEVSDSGADPAVLALLDKTIVGSFNNADITTHEPSEIELSVFTQQLSASPSPTISLTQGAFKQSEIVDFTIWLIFRRHAGHNRPSHLLAQGYQRSAAGSDCGLELVGVPGIPGIFCNGTNRHAMGIKKSPWSLLPSLIGDGAERILSDLLLRCGVYVPVENTSNLEQVCGVPMSELKTRTTNPNRDPCDADTDVHHQAASLTPKLKARGLGDIRLVRHRMLYARPALNAKGRVRFGLAHAHVLNQYRDPKDRAETIHTMRYIFPRQFGHHNVFTSEVNSKETAHPFQDYTTREEEIARATLRWRRAKAMSCPDGDPRKSPIPKRLRGMAQEAVGRLRKRHQRCPYRTLLDYYCPSNVSQGTTNAVSMASSLTQVSAFCRAAVSRVFPDTFWGSGSIGSHNKSVVLGNVNTFIRLRRYETMSLHDILQHMEVSGIQWLGCSVGENKARLSQTDFTKRKELMSELLYYLFDSFLIPLIRGHFHVTESGVSRNQLFYFRHDVWNAVSKPALAALKTDMLEPCNTADVKKELANRTLGIGQVRLLPKEKGMRPIINLRRRVQMRRRGELVLGRSINSVLTPAFSILNSEKASKPQMLASALFSVDDMYPRLQHFRHAIENSGLGARKLFFAKVDVKACFDTIPQKKLLEVARELIGSESYKFSKYSRAKLVGGRLTDRSNFGSKPSWKFLTKAASSEEFFNLDHEIKADAQDGRSRHVYVDGGLQKVESRQDILDLLEQHVEANLIQVGDRFYRQKRGIPQGSIVSSLLCSFFYAEMERQELQFISDDDQSTLFRLIDDFLVISTRREVAERFMRLMHGGLPVYGIEVKAEKSRTNFDLSIRGSKIARLPDDVDFPYCGNAINTVTLDLSRDQERRKQTNLADSMSVEYSQLPGQTFYRKIMTAMKLQMRAMFLSTSYNGVETVLSNLYRGFTEVAQKMYYYIRALPTRKKPLGSLIVRTVDDLISLACVLLRRRKRGAKELLPYECEVSGPQARWIALKAFLEVFQRRQAGHEELLVWLAEQSKSMDRKSARDRARARGSRLQRMERHQVETVLEKEKRGR